MKKPIIGITTDHRTETTDYTSRHAYADAISAAGGLPLLLPYRPPLSDIPALLDLLQGILLTGGDDLNPRVWGEEPHPKSGPIDPDREKYERALLTEIERRRLPTLGICLGCQLMNVYRGGSLKQYIPDLNLTPTLEHRHLSGKDGQHPISIQPNSVLAQTLGTTHTESNSAHKQTVGQLGQRLHITATSPDGIVEAIEDPSLPLFLGVQWHPERFHQSPHEKLFQTLINKARESSTSK